VWFDEWVGGEASALPAELDSIAGLPPAQGEGASRVKGRGLRVLLMIDPRRQVILLLGGDKSDA